jgi:hypothetical protein
MQRLYLWICKRWGPDKLTLSAYAWKRAMETGDHSARIRLDGLFMLLKKQQGHCSSQYQRETRGE